MISIRLQSTLGFATMGKAANLALATRNAVTDLFQYYITTLYLATSNFGPYVAKQRPSTLLVVAIPSGGQNTLDLATTWSLNQAKIHLIQRPLLGLATSTPMTEASRKTQCRLQLPTQLRGLRKYKNPWSSGFVQITTLLAPNPSNMSIGSGMFQNLNMIWARQEYE